MTITKARQDRLGAPAMDADERKALELQVENGSARMKKIVWNARGYTHFLTASDGWTYLVTIADERERGATPG